MSIGNRIAITLAIALAIMFALALCGYQSGRWDEADAESPICMDDTTRERVRAIMLDAIDNALKDQIMHLFETWMKDEREQPRRAVVGARQATRAYLGSRKAALEWNPPTCP